MIFKVKPPEWRNPGVDPPEELKSNGFVAGYKPPAAFFNWFFHNAYECFRELQEKATELEERKTIVLMEQDIPVSERRANTFYLRVTDKQTITTVDNIKVSPNMGLRIL